jgi:hypothetical protein
MNFQGKDGELRVYSYGYKYGADLSRTTYYLEILFCDMNFTAPTARPRTDETLVMDRGKFDGNAHYVQSDDEPRYAPLDMSFSCRLGDTINTRILHEWLSGVTSITNTVGGTSQIYSWAGYAETAIDGNIIPSFESRTYGKPVYRVEVLWDGTNDYGLRYDAVWFKPGQSTITESKDGLTLNAKAMVYGDVTRILSFYTGTAFY